MNLDRLASAAALVSSTRAAARIPQPLLRDRSTFRVPLRALGAGIEAGSTGARKQTYVRRERQEGVDLDLTNCYGVGNALGGVDDLLTHEVTAHHLSGAGALARLAKIVHDAVRADLLSAPEIWRALSFLALVRPSGDILTAHFTIADIEATLTTTVVKGSIPIWLTGSDLAVGVIEDLDRGGRGRVPEIIEAWTFSSGPLLRGLRAVKLLERWTFDPRKPSNYVSRDGLTWGHLPLMLGAMRIDAKTDPSLSEATRLRRRGMLKIASVSAAFGMYLASYPDASLGLPHQVITSDGLVTLNEGTPERAGAWAFPPAGALAEGFGRLLLTLVLHEARVRGVSPVGADTDGAFLSALRRGEQA